MLNRIIKKIHHHRISFLIFISFAFLLYLGLNPINLSKYYGARFSSAVGMSVGVSENPVNKIAKQLRAKEERLNNREIELNKLEKKIKQKPASDKFIISLMEVGIISLFLLIIINFYLDRRHRSKINRLNNKSSYRS